MAKRYCRMTTVIHNSGPRYGNPEWLIGHPCGPIANYRWLKEHPKDSVRTAELLLQDANITKGDFETMIMRMHMMKLKIGKRAKLHLKQWIKLGCPTWRQHEQISAWLTDINTRAMHCGMIYHDWDKLNEFAWGHDL